jgi:hypothetical protein
MNYKLIAIEKQLLSNKKESLKRVEAARKQLVKKGHIPNDLTVAEVIKVAKRLSVTAQKNLLRQLLRNSKYRKEAIPLLIRSKALGSIEHVLKLANQKTKGLSLITQEFLSPDIFLNLYKKDQKKIVAANHKEISESFLYRYFLNDEQHAIKLLLELKPAELAKVMDGLFILDEDYRVFESKYLSETDTLGLIKNLNDRRLQKVLQIRESFLLIVYAGRHDLKLITKLFDLAEPRSIQNLFNFCLASEIEKRATHSPRKKKLTDEAAHKMVIEIVFQAHKNRNLSNPVITGLVKLASKPDKVKDLLEAIYTDEARRRFVENLIRDFAEKKTPEKISLINRIQFLTELMMVLAHNRKILYKILESISEENRLIVEGLLGVKK